MNSHPRRKKPETSAAAKAISSNGSIVGHSSVADQAPPGQQAGVIHGGVLANMIG
jgi:hypothetical protein